MTQEGKNIKQAYQYQAKVQWKKKPITGPVQIGISLYFGTKRRQDIDNFGKVLLDSLTGVIWEDDSQVAEMNIRKGYDKAKPRIEIEINQLP